MPTTHQKRLNRERQRAFRRRQERHKPHHVHIQLHVHGKHAPLIREFADLLERLDNEGESNA